MTYEEFKQLAEHPQHRDVPAIFKLEVLETEELEEKKRSHYPKYKVNTYCPQAFTTTLEEAERLMHQDVLYRKKMKEEDRIFRQAHDCCFSNKEQIEKSEKCGCFFCGEIFSPSEITDYLPDEPPTAECPFCYTDSVIGDASGFPITKDFLKKMRKRYF